MATRLRNSAARVYRMRDINHGAAAVLRELHEGGDAALVSKHGRFVGLLVPLDDQPVAAAALARMPLEDSDPDDDMGNDLSANWSVPENADRLVVTMRELSQQTSGVFARVTASGKAAFITNRGRFVAMLVPLAQKNLEAEILGRMVDFMADEAMLSGTKALDAAGLRSSTD